MPGIDVRAPQRQETSSGFVRVAELHAHRLFGLLQGRRRLRRVSDSGNLLPFGEVDGAELGGDGEAGGHGQAELGHLGQVGALAAQQVLHRRIAFGALAGRRNKRTFRPCQYPLRVRVVGRVGRAVARPTRNSSVGLATARPTLRFDDSPRRSLRKTKRTNLSAPVGTVKEGPAVACHPTWGRRLHARRSAHSHLSHRSHKSHWSHPLAKRSEGGQNCSDEQDSGSWHEDR